jgi:hypothetical protein
VKRRVLGWLIFVFALWPLAQYALVERFGTDPWKLFGWAMYSVPGPMKTVRVFEIARDGRFEALDFQAYTPEEQELVDTFRERRRALGALQSAEALARGMLDLHPDFEGVVVAIVSLELSPESARLVPRLERSTHWRDGRDDPFEFELPPPFEGAPRGGARGG